MKPSHVFPAVAFLAFLFFQPTLRADDHQPARPGTVNYVEGQVFLGTQSLDANSVGKALVDPGETLTTQTGKAEILLTPGIFVRLGDSSSATMISSGLTNTRMSIDRGEALIEVAEIHPENDLRILLDGKSTELLRTGLYDFNKNQHLVRVLDGEVLVSGGDKRVKVKSGYLVDITRPTIPSAATVGLAKAGTGILGSTPTHFFPAMASSSALLAGAFIHHGARTLHPSTVATTTVILIPEFKHGVPEPTTASLVTTATVFNMQRIREVHWLVARDRVCSAEVARMAAASMAEEDFMVVVDFTEEQASVGTGRREIVELG